jgi:hypothetical protein
MADRNDSFYWPDGKRAAVSLTFDDARRSQVDTGMPILKDHGVRATFYVSLPNLEQRPEAWREAAAEGHEIGNHTLTHPCSGNFPWVRSNALEDYTLKRMEAEMTDANRRIEELLGLAPRTFAYPCGQKYVGRGVNARSYVPLVAKHFLAGRGFRDETPNDSLYCDLAQLMAVDGDGLTFEQGRVWVDRAIREGSWLVFVAHEIGDPGVHQTIPCDTLAALCRYCQAPENGVWIDTVQAVASHILLARS